jgi:hypothetical protein
MQSRISKSPQVVLPFTLDRLSKIQLGASTSVRFSSHSNVIRASRNLAPKNVKDLSPSDSHPRLSSHDCPHLSGKYIQQIPKLATQLVLDRVGSATAWSPYKDCVHNHSEDEELKSVCIGRGRHLVTFSNGAYYVYCHPEGGTFGEEENT